MTTRKHRLKIYTLDVLDSLTYRLPDQTLTVLIMIAFNVGAILLVRWLVS